MKLSIIFIHKGNSWYLPYTLWQCRQTNPDADIYLIGDHNTAHLKNIVTHVDINEFSNSGNELKKLYVHYSTLGEEFEIACIERWFILLDFLKERKLINCIYLDSDILVYKNLESYAERFKSCPMTWCSFSAHSNFISDISYLQLYCNFILDCYKDKMPPAILQDSLFNAVMTGKRKDLNISDMTFFYDFNLLNDHALLVISNPSDFGTFDISMEEVRVFEAGEDGFKKVTWKNNNPFCRVVETNEKVLMATLHFQGSAKALIKQCFKYKSLSFIIEKVNNDFHLFKMKVSRRKWFSN